MKTVLSKLIAAGKTFLQRLVITLQLYGENGLANHAAACAYGFLLSITPMLLLIAIFIFAVFRPSPEGIAAFIGNIPFLGSLFDEQLLSSDFFSFSTPGISSIIFVLSIIWAGRILALSMQRGLKIIFPADKNRNPVKNTLVTLSIEISVIILILMSIISSRTALRLYRLFDFSPEFSVLQIIMSYTGSQISSIFLLGAASFLAYLFVPVNSPRKLSALKGSFFCVLLYFCTALIMGILLDISRYNFLYGTLGNLIVLLINVYFFFLFFFLGAQFAFVIDSFDMLLFIKLRQSRNKVKEKNETAGSARQWHTDLFYKFFYPAKDNLRKYLRHYKKDEIIFSQGDSGNDVYYLIEGEVEILISSSDGTVSSVDVLKADSFFGEMGSLLSEDRTATVRAKARVTAIALPLSLFDTVLKYDTSLDRVLLQNMSRRLKDKNEAITFTF